MTSASATDQKFSRRPDPGPGLRSGRLQRTADPAFRWFLSGAGLCVLLVLGWMIVSTTIDSWPVFESEGLNLFFGREWSPGNARDGSISGTYGGFEFLFGTVVTAVLALLFAIVPATGIALYLTQLAPRRLAKMLGYTVDLLAAVPSIIYGLWGSLFLVPVLMPFMTRVSELLGPFLPAFAGPVRVRNLFIASLVLGVMVLPITSAVIREVIAQTPREERFAAFGLGATRWEVIRHVVLPRSTAGIIGGAMLGLGRALGETIAVLLIIGGNARAEFRLFDTSQTVASQIAAAFKEASPEYINALLALGVALFVITVLVNMLARFIVNRLGHVTGDAAL
ncbi:MAG: phosphate ABC transporter permease subunit PstC [Acidimicrobiia bacterium]|nr:phosphate ABC transporter permease subunit PstC [Acidimicrobiia bacterium]